MAVDLVRGVGESLLSSRPSSRPATAAMPPVPDVAAPNPWTKVPAAAGRSAGVPAVPQPRSPGRKRAAAQLSMAASGTPAAKVAAHTLQPSGRGGITAAEQASAAVPQALAPAPDPGPQPSDPDIQPLAAGLSTLPSFSSWKASGSQGSSAGGRSLRRSRSAGSGSVATAQAVSGSGGGGGRRSSGSEAAPLPGPVPLHSTEITFMPLGHGGSKWPTGVEAPPDGAPRGAAAVAAVLVLARSTVAALLGEPLTQQLDCPRMPSRPAAGAVQRSLDSEGTDEWVDAAALELPAYRPWTAVRRVMEEVGRQAGSDAPLTSHRPAGQQGQAARPGCLGSVDSSSTVAMPWDRPSVPRFAEGATSAHPPRPTGRPAAGASAAQQHSMHRPPRPPGSRAAPAAPAAGRQAVQPRPLLPPPLPPPVRHALCSS